MKTNSGVPLCSEPLPLEEGFGPLEAGFVFENDIHSESVEVQGVGVSADGQIPLFTAGPRHHRPIGDYDDVVDYLIKVTGRDHEECGSNPTCSSTSQREPHARTPLCICHAALNDILRGREALPDVLVRDIRDVNLRAQLEEFYEDESSE